MTVEEIEHFRDRAAASIELLTEARELGASMIARGQAFEEKASKAIETAVGLLAAAELVLDEARAIQRRRAESN